MVDWPRSSKLYRTSSASSSGVSISDSSVMVMWWHEDLPSPCYEPSFSGLVSITSCLFTFNKPWLVLRVIKKFLFIWEGTLLWISPSPFASQGNSLPWQLSTSVCLIQRQTDARDVDSFFFVSMLEQVLTCGPPSLRWLKFEARVVCTFFFLATRSLSKSESIVVIEAWHVLFSFQRS